MNKTVSGTELSIKEYRVKLVCDKKEYLKRQKKALEVFYKDSFNWSCMNIWMWCITGIMVFVQIPFFMMPYQEIMGDSGDGKGLLRIVMFIGVVAAMTYIQPYCYYKDNVVIRVYDKIKYLPVSREVIRYFRFKKLLKFQGIVFAIALVLQITVSLLALGEIVLGNILYTLIACFLIPFAVTGVYILLQDSFVVK